MYKSNKIHWESIYSTKSQLEVSWYQAYPKTSIGFLESPNLPLTARIIDVGGGDSHFVDALLAKGYENIYVLDISAIAIEKARKRLGEKARFVHWIVSDINDFEPEVQFDFWHDRAAFHFLMTKEAQDRYVEIASASVVEGGFMMVGTFSDQGPEKCSGLQIQQYNEESLSARFDSGFRRVKCIREDHLTPFNTVQNFVFCSFIKIAR